VQQIQFSAAKKRSTNLLFKAIGQINCGKIISTGLNYTHLLVFVAKEIHRVRLWEIINLQCQHSEKEAYVIEVQ
jgi:hypothetical protein